MDSLRSPKWLRMESERGTEERPAWRVMVWLVEGDSGRA